MWYDSRANTHSLPVCLFSPLSTFCSICQSCSMHRKHHGIEFSYVALVNVCLESVFIVMWVLSISHGHAIQFFLPLKFSIPCFWSEVNEFVLTSWAYVSSQDWAEVGRWVYSAPGHQGSWRQRSGGRLRLGRLQSWRRDSGKHLMYCMMYLRPSFMVVLYRMLCSMHCAITIRML